MSQTDDFKKLIIEVLSDNKYKAWRISGVAKYSSVLS